MPVWKELALPLNVKGNPTLLIKYEFRNDGYKVLVTDLTYLWVEDLGRKGVIKRALVDDIEIDPSVGQDQLSHLLDRILKALERDSGTSMIVTATEDKETITLHLEAKLKAPLNQLHWRIHLKLASPQEFSKEVVLPMLGELYSTSTGQSDLWEKLVQKDKIIKTLKARLSTAGVSGEDVFRDKRSAQKFTEASVPGLTEFHGGDWHKEQNRNATIPAQNLREKLFRTGLAYQPVNEAVVCVEEWWDDLGDGVKIEPKKKSRESEPPKLTKNESSKGFQSDERSEPSTDDDPPSPKAPGADRSINETAKNRPSNFDDDSDTDSTASELGEPIRTVRKRTRSPSSSSSESPKPCASKSKAPSRSPSNPASNPPQSSPKPVSNKPTSKLGRIGGPQASSSRAPSTTPSAQASAAKPKTKIGQIGGSNKPLTKDTALSQSDQLPSRDAAVQNSFAFDADPEDEIKETEIEKANRRREMLKRQQNARPIKRGRKF